MTFDVEALKAYAAARDAEPQYAVCSQWFADALEEMNPLRIAMARGQRHLRRQGWGTTAQSRENRGSFQPPNAMRGGGSAIDH